MHYFLFFNITAEVTGELQGSAKQGLVYFTKYEKEKR
jgi:hypothetical protein